MKTKQNVFKKCLINRKDENMCYNHVISYVMQITCYSKSVYKQNKV